MIYDDDRCLLQEHNQQVRHHFLPFDIHCNQDRTCCSNIHELAIVSCSVFLLLFALWHYSKKKMEDNYAWLTPLIFFSTPTFFSAASSAYVELQAATYVFLAFYCWENGYEQKKVSWFILMTLFAGASVATKPTCVIILPLTFLGIAVYGRAHKNENQNSNLSHSKG